MISASDFISILTRLRHGVATGGINAMNEVRASNLIPCNMGSHELKFEPDFESNLTFILSFPLLSIFLISD